MTPTQYADLIFGAVDFIKDNIILPNSSGSEIRTRYITSQGTNDEQWLGFLRDEDGSVDIWLLTITGIKSNDNENAIGTFDKPMKVVMDYFYSYRQGYDETNSVTNSEREFLRKIFAVDFALEQKKGCLTNRIYIRDWEIKSVLKRFENDTCHWGQGVINLALTEVIL